MERLNRVMQVAIKDEAYILTPVEIGFSAAATTVFTFSLASSIVMSVVSGAFSLTMAQFNLYETKHEFDTGIVDKAILWVACFVNTLSILIAETVYFCFGFPSFFLLMLYTLRVARGELVRPKIITDRWSYTHCKPIMHMFYFFIRPL